jgi:zinc protease
MAAGVRAPALPTVKRRIRGGIPIFAVDGPGPASCALIFRVGRADETLLTGGVTHLIEHLTLFPVGDQPYDYNGFVEPHRTVFHATGTPEECVEFLATVTESLMDLPMHRLEHEHRVLEAEARGRSSGLYDALVTYRYGPAGLGLVAYPELCIQSMSARKVDAWRAANFTAGNVALVVSGIPVEDIRLTLPGGERRPPVVAPEIETDLPGWFPYQGTAIGLSMVGPAGSALAAGARILEKRLLRRLRTEMGIVYQVGVSVQTLDGDSVHVVVASDPVPERTAEALKVLEEELAHLTDEGPDEAELHADRRALRRDFDEPQGAYALANYLAVQELLDADPRTPAAVAKVMRAVTVDDVADALATARQTALWAVPRHVEAPEHVRAVSIMSKPRTGGRRLAPVAPHVSGYEPDDRLVLGDHGVGIDGGDWHLHVDYAHCVGALAWSDGVRILYGDDGFILRLRPWEWRDGRTAVAAIDSSLDPALVVDMGEGDGPPPVEMPAPRPRAERSAGPTWRRVAVALLLAFLGFMAAVVPFSSPVLQPADIVGVPVESVPVDADGDVRCGGSSIAIVRNGARVPGEVVDPRVASACQSEARSDLTSAAVFLVVFLAGTGWVVYRRVQASRAG